MKEVILIGNPNSGKTTLFNTLTKSNEKASNWHGVTVDSKSKISKLTKENIMVTDLPGVYSIEGYSNEEKIAIEYLLMHKDSIVINIVDANNIYRSLRLTSELLKLGLEVIVAINMSKEIKLVNYDMISKEWGVLFVEIDARNKKGVRDLLKILNNIIVKKPQKTNKNHKNIIINTQEMQKYCNKQQKSPYAISDKIDKVILNKFIFPVVFLIAIFLVFYLTFGEFGCAISSVFVHILNYIFNIMRKIIYCININNVIKIFMCEGVLSTLESILAFIPQIVLMLFLLNLLEDMGLMSRMAFMFDGILKKIGLNGKSLFSIFLGYGCTTTAVLTTRNLENNDLRRRTIFLLPFSSCSAKLPVFLVIVSLFFEKYKYLFVFGLYLFSIITSLVVAVLLKKFHGEYDNVFLMEMPKLRFPTLKKIFLDSIKTLKDFVIKVGVLILFFGTFVWLLQNFSLDLKFLNGEKFELSLLYQFANIISPIFKFVGIDNVGVVAALLLGLVAKEMIVVGLVMMNGVGGAVQNLTASLISVSSTCNFSVTSSVIFLIFVLFYSPCFSALATIKNEVGVKAAIKVFVFQFVVAYVIAFLTYQIFLNPNILLFVLAAIILDIALMLVLKLKKKNNCRGNCRACRKI